MLLRCQMKSLELKRFITRMYSKMVRTIRGASVDDFRVLMYHQVTEQGSKNDFQNLYSIDDQLFNSHMGHIVNKYHDVRDVGELSSNSSQAGIGLTFDDGHLSVLQQAEPTLRRHEIPFTVFVVAGWLRGGKSRYLSVQDLRELTLNKHCSIGSHSFSHSPLVGLDEKTRRKEVLDSRLMLEDILGRSVKMFSYPYGLYDAYLKAAVQNYGYSAAFTSDFGGCNKNFDPFAIRRIEIWNTDTIADLDEKIRGDWDWIRYTKYLRR